MKIPVQAGQTYDVKIVDLTYQGLGVAKIEDFPVFVNNALPGETATIKVNNVKKNFAFGTTVKILTKSADRVDNVNQNYLQTGIAPLQHLSYEGQLRFKQHQIKTLFDKQKIDVDVLPTMGMEHPDHYRNKALIPVKMVNGELTTGFYKHHSHDLVPIEDFYIQQPEIDRIILVVRDILRRFHVRPYDEEHHSGVIRNIMVRRGYYSHEVMIGLITRTKKLQLAEPIVKAIVEALPDVTSIIQNVNTKDSNVLLGKQNHVLYGKQYIEDQLMGLTFAISLNSFYQVNPVQTEKLYTTAIDQAGLSDNDVVIDAYCGIGTISLAVAKHVKKVYGVEIVPQAIEDAKINAQKNHINNVEFVANTAEAQMEKWQSQGLKPDAIIVDPPRKGLAESFIESAVEMAPQKLIYVSCNPSTLVRDAKRLLDSDYHIAKPIQPVDQFPQTVHVESVTVFEKN